MNTTKNLNAKSIAQGFFEETSIDDDFFVLTFKNETNAPQIIERDIDSSFIQFHFCVKGLSKFNFNSGNYVLNANGFPTASATESFLGDPNADWRGGLGTNISYKGGNFKQTFTSAKPISCFLKGYFLFKSSKISHWFFPSE